MTFGCTHAPASEHEKSRLLVKARAGVSLESLDAILERQGARRVDSIRKIDVHVVEVDAARARAVVQSLTGHPAIEFVEVDERAPPSVPSSTPRRQ